MTASPGTTAAARPKKDVGLWVLLATIIASGMAIVDSTAVNVALPALTQDIGATEVEFLWIVGPVIASLGWFYFSLPYFSGNYWTTFFSGFVLLGLGMSIVVAPLTTVVMTSFDDSKAGVASGINNAASHTAGLIAVALFGALVTVVFNIGLDTQTALLELPDAALTALAQQENLLTAPQVPPGLTAELSLALDSAIKDSLLSGTRAAMVLSGALAFASAGFAALMIRYRPAPAPAGDE